MTIKNSRNFNMKIPFPTAAKIDQFIMFILNSRLSFVVAEACLLAGSARNAYHTKYLGYYLKRDLSSCAALRKGVFAAAAAFVLVSMVASLLFYWSYSKADTGGWVRHQNEGGIGMAEYDPDKGEFGVSKT